MNTRRLACVICLVPLALAAVPNPDAEVEPEPNAQHVSDISSAIRSSLQTALDNEDAAGVKGAFAPAIAASMLLYDTQHAQHANSFASPTKRKILCFNQQKPKQRL